MWERPWEYITSSKGKLQVQKQIPKVLFAGETMKPRCHLFWFVLGIDVGGEISWESWQFQANLLDLICFPSDRKIFTFISKLTNWIQKFVDACGKCSMIIATPPTVEMPKISLAHERQLFCVIRSKSFVSLHSCKSLWFTYRVPKSWGIYINI